MAACAGADDPAIGGPAGAGGGDGPGATDAPAGDGEPAPTPPAGDGDGGLPEDGDAAGPGGTAPATTAPGPPPTPDVDRAAGGPPGSFAPHLLQPRAGARLIVEVLSAPGAEPLDTTVEHLASVVGRESAKDVTVSRGAVAAGGGPSWTAEEIRAAAEQAALGAQDPESVRMRILFLGGGLEGNDTALGVAVRGDVAAVFPDRVEQASSLLGTARLERAVAVHEAGHLLGLVDLFLDTGREDPEHPGHSPSKESVMYWAVESTLVGQLLGGGPPTDFDAADRADLARIRSGG